MQSCTGPHVSVSPGKTGHPKSRWYHGRSPQSGKRERQDDRQARLP